MKQSLKRDSLALCADSVLADRRLIISGIGLLVILPMCFPRNLGALAWVSVAAVVGFIFTAIAVVVRGLGLVHRRPHDVRYDDVYMWRFNYQALFSIPIVVFGFNCHANVVTIMTCVPCPAMMQLRLSFSAI